MRNLVMLGLLFILVIVPTNAANAQYSPVMKDFYCNATEAGTATRWQLIHWQTSMDDAQKQANSQKKPILVVLHNNYRGDSSSHDC